MPNTPKGLTYPSSSSPVAVPADIQELAEDVDGLIVPNTGGTYTGSVSFTQPPSVPTPTSGLHAVNKTYADAINADVTALETELGTNPSGTFSTVVQRLDSYTDGFNKVGNLLTDNQASGGDTLGDTTGFVDFGHETTRIYTTSDSKNGAGCIKTTLVGASAPLTGVSGAFACSPGETVTFLAALKVAATSGKVRPNLMFRLADNSYVYPEGSNLTGSAWGWCVITSVAPATAVSVSAYIYAYDFAPGEYYLLDSPSVHKGAGGRWSMPGIPIPGQSHIAVNNAVDLSGTGSPEGVVTAAPGSTWLQTDATTDVKGWIRWVKATGTGNTGWQAGAEADTGTRNLNGVAWANGWAPWGTNGQRLRRVGNVVDMEIDLTKASATSDTCYTLPSGFRPFSPSIGAAFTCQSANSAVPAEVVVVNGDINVIRSSISGDVMYMRLCFITSDAWPTSLPGSAA